MLTLEDVSKEYNNVVALNNIHATIHESEVVGLIGKNGAGKTTLLEIAAGLIKPTSGAVKVNNKMDYNPNMIGYLEDDPVFYDYLTTKETIHYYALMQNSPISTTDSDKLLKEYNLFTKRNIKVKDLSRGMKQLLGFLLTMLPNPKILLLDEPFTGLDPANMKLMKSKLLNLKREGKIIIISTHILSFASDICNRVLFLDQGRITYKTEEDTFLTENSLESLFSEHIK